MPRLSRLFQPRSIAVFGGGWAENVIIQCHKMGFDGAIWPVHPNRTEIAGVSCYKSVATLPSAPDAAFLGINRQAVIRITKQLAMRGCGGAVCFASGFAESGDVDLQQQLVAAAGTMPLLGPNCYGFINYLDGVLLWPDQHGGARCEHGVAFISQSSNIAINLGMQKRGLPIGYIACVGNQAQTSLTDMTKEVLEDPRITVAGLYIEEIENPTSFAHMAQSARQNGKYIVAIKTGKTKASKQAAGAHTAALAGDAAASSAFLHQCGVVEVNSLEEMVETLKILHLFGALPRNRISAMCCSGGEAGLLADSAANLPLVWPDIPAANRTALANCLGPLVHLANPLDYHTFIWGDVPAMTNCFASMMGTWVDICCLVIDFPRADRCDRAAWMPALTAMGKAATSTDTKVAILASLPEGMPDDIAAMAIKAGILPLCGFQAGLSAVAHAVKANSVTLASGVWQPAAVIPEFNTTVLDEAAAKSALMEHGVMCPASVTGTDPAMLADLANKLKAPLVLKGLGVLHKSERGFVKLDLTHADLQHQAREMNHTGRFLVEEMVAEPLVELLVGVRRDSQYGLHLTVASGGILAELFSDSESLILPVSRADIKASIKALRLAPLLDGYRGRQAANFDAAIDQIIAVCDLITHDRMIAAIEVNPLIIGTCSAVAVDALLWRYKGAQPRGDLL